MYRRLAEAAVDSPELAQALAGARLLVSGSAALPASEHARLRELTGRGVVERYGMTETLMNTAIHADAEPQPGTVGPPLPGVDLRLVDDDGEVLTAADEETIGEIQVRGPNLFLEYLNRPDATAESMRDDWFATGDMATRTSPGLHQDRRAPRDRPHQERRLQDRRRRDRGLPARAPGRGGRRRHRGGR